MAYKNTLAELKASTVRTIAGVCADSTQFVQMANEVQRRLLRRGNWYDTEWLTKICFTNGCVVWPRYVGTVLATRMCDGSLGEVKNRWYSILGGANSLARSYSDSTDYSWFGDVVMMDNGTKPTYNAVSGTTGKLIRYYVKYQNDIGKKITLYGKQYGGQPLQELDANGNWVNGLTLTAVAPFATTTVLVTQIDSVVREATQGECRLYEYDSTSNLLRDLALYEPNETNPRYRSSLISDWCAVPGCLQTTTVDSVDYEQKVATIEALVKLEHFDLVNDNDFLLIDNLDAFKMGFQAVKLEEMNDEKNAEIKWMKAVRELNFELRDKNPDRETPVFVNVVNGSAIYSPT